MKRKELFEQHRKYYNPKNTILTVVGNNEIEEVIELTKYYKNKIKELRNK